MSKDGRMGIPTYTTMEAVRNAVDLLNREAAALLRINPQTALEKATEAENIAQAGINGAGYEAGILRSIVHQAHALNQQSKFDRALTLALQVEARVSEMLPTPHTMKSHRLAVYAAGYAYDDLGDFPKAIIYYKRLCTLSEKADDHKHMIIGYNGIAITYSHLEEYETVIHYLQLARALIEQSDVVDPYAMFLSSNNLGNTYIDAGQPEKGLEFALKAFDLSDHIQSPALNGLLADTIAKGYMMLGAYEKAETFYQRAFDLYKLSNDDAGLTDTTYRYGEFLYAQDRHEEAEAILNEALQLATGGHYLRLVYLCHQSLSSVAEAKQEFKVALYHHKQFQAIQSEVLSEKNRDKLRHLRVSYEVEAVQKEAEIYRLQTERMLKALEQAETTKALYANIMQTIMHEFRTPLAVISNSSSLIHRHLHKMSDEKQTEVYSRIREAVQYVANLLDEVGKIEQLSDANLAPYFSPVIVGEWSREMVDFLKQKTADPSNVTYVFDPADETTIEVDTKMTQAIVLELLDNAIKYTPDDKPITVEIGMDEAGVVITVTDEGVGIAADEIDNIFELFYRAYKAGDIPGLGTGLYVVVMMVTALGGEIRVESEGVGLGSIFSLKLPRSLRTT